MDYAISISNVSKSIKETEILKNISFNMRKGEIVGLIGPNGAGKTSLMRILVGLTKKYEGTVSMDDIQNIGCIIETPNFYPYLSGQDNMKYFAALNNVSNGRIPVTLALLGLTEAAWKKVKNYSLGMRQRLAIARALLTDPELLILDEPTNGLDPEGIHEVREYIRLITKKRNITVLISSHMLSELEKICDKAFVIKEGSLIKEIQLNKDEATEGIKLVVETQEIDKAEEILKANDFDVSRKDQNLIVNIANKSKAAIAQLLFSHQIPISGLYEYNVNLESTFLDLVD